MRKCKTTQKREEQLHQIQCLQFLFLKQIYDNKTKIIRTIHKKGFNNYILWTPYII